MTLAYVIVREEGPFPRQGRLILTCDGDHGLFPHSQSFEHRDGFMGEYRAAMAAGWKDTFWRGERVFFGPCCSGKTPRE